MKASVNPYGSLLEWAACNLILGTSRNHSITETSSSFLKSLGEGYALALALGEVPDPDPGNDTRY